MSIKMGWSHLMESSGNMLESASNELFNGRRMQLNVNSGWRSFHAPTSRKRWPFNLYFLSPNTFYSLIIQATRYTFIHR
ncbi:hypothetical protein AYX14_03343 [Cryptococcus neoformans]|nr:hypothetical protein AYX15_01147 [Cryptococcus neoformans var. grubii]OWZ71243.1 hypothetical protein AYX14_03343 [Cryptococcus neoformans var. grubii]